MCHNFVSKVPCHHNVRKIFFVSVFTKFSLQFLQTDTSWGIIGYCFWSVSTLMWLTLRSPVPPLHDLATILSRLSRLSAWFIHFMLFKDLVAKLALFLQHKVWRKLRNPAVACCQFFLSRYSNLCYRGDFIVKIYKLWKILEIFAAMRKKIIFFYLVTNYESTWCNILKDSNLKKKNQSQILPQIFLHLLY